jgi:hypothetical protein
MRALEENQMKGLKPTLLAVCLLLLVAGTGLQIQTVFATSQQGIPGKHVFLPVINSMPPATVDLQITELNVSQAVQDRQNSVSLVADRLTMLRVFAQSVGPTSQVAAVVSVSALRGGTVIGEVRSIPRVIPSQPAIENYDSTFNFMLPPEWLSGEVVLLVTVDPDGAVAEMNEGNNAVHRRRFSITSPN